MNFRESIGVACPADLNGCGTAREALRGGGRAFLDATHARDWERVARNLADIMMEGPGGMAGIILRGRDIGRLGANLDSFLAAGNRVVVSGPCSEIPGHLRSGSWWREITRVEEMDGPGPWEGWLAKGHEAGGRVGEDALPILVQKVRERVRGPVWARGAFGIHGAAALRLSGVDGLLLDDVALLMPGTPLPEEWTQTLRRTDGTQSVPAGDIFRTVYRVFAGPGFAGSAALVRRSDACGGDEEWESAAEAVVAWGDPALWAWPVGQGVALAEMYRRRYGNVRRLLAAVECACEGRERLVRKHGFLVRNGPLAKSHGVEFPVIQGPMTRVSDTAEFAEAVASGGGLPMLALAVMRGREAAGLLDATRSRLGERPWGVGILGFVPEELRKEQLAEVLARRPRVALIAGGRPDQAAELERAGIATYLHVPSPGLLSSFLEAGARRFVFEGRECGGHVGPLGSLILWEQAVEGLLEALPRGTEPEAHAVFAGGIHDGWSARLVEALAAPLAARGVRCGILMGTAYLFTEEAVACGAIGRVFQEEAMKCARTVNLPSGVGHASRCVWTPFAEEYLAARRRLMVEGTDAAVVRERLEEMNLGRLRVASKGIRREGAELVAVGEEAQRREGMFMIGQAATVRKSVGTIRGLHEEVCGGRPLAVVSSGERSGDRRPSDVAIIGMSVLLPGAHDLEAYWANILSGRSAIREIPAERFDWRLYFDPDPSAPDKIYAKWGAFLDPVAFDPLRYGIPPNALASIDPNQLLALEAAQRALEDAGYGGGDFDRERTSVILGAGTGEKGSRYSFRSELPRFVGPVGGEVMARLPEWTEESFPGMLPNVAAGRIANRLDLGGSNFVVDAACASGLAAIGLGVRELESGRSNLVVAGGLDTAMGPPTFLSFAKTRALSARGRSAPFDAAGDGIVIGEGVAVVVLKRLAEAVRDGDRVYAVIKGVGTSSDGRALGMTAPLPEGQRRALRRAYRAAGYSPGTVGMFEAHGTGTAVGDRAEVETLVGLMREEGVGRGAACVGSVKSQIGHTKSAAGAAGLVKAALALSRGVQPAHWGIEKPLPALHSPEAPVFLLSAPRPWLVADGGGRRAGVSAFGFGGTNVHVTLEEPPREACVRGGGAWPAELMVIRAADAEGAARELERWGRKAREGGWASLAGASAECARAANASSGGYRVAIVAESLKEFGELCGALGARLRAGGEGRLPQGCFVGSGEAGQMAWLFPGQGSQAPGMLREAALFLEPLRRALESASRAIPDIDGVRLADLLYPPAAFDERERREQAGRLSLPRAAQVSLAAVEMGLASWMRSLGAEPALAGGHSFGELAAMAAAGCWPLEAFFSLADKRGGVMEQARCGGGMASLSMPRPAAEALAAEFPGVSVANHNGPDVVVVAGPEDSIARIVERCKAGGTAAVRLPVAAAFHTPLMRNAAELFRLALELLPPGAPAIPVFCNVDGKVYPADAGERVDRLVRHLWSPVEFAGMVREMHAAGARVFVEVGPGRALTGMVRRILSDVPHLAVAMDGARGGLKGVLDGLAALYAAGVPVRVERIAGARAEALETAARRCSGDWLVDGARVFRRGTENDAGYKSAPRTADDPPPAALGLASAGGVNMTVFDEYQRTMQTFLNVQEKVMRRFLSGGNSGADVPTSDWERLAAPPTTAEPEAVIGMGPGALVEDRREALEPPEAPPSEVAGPSDTLTSESAARLVLELVSDRTGYPVAMLNLTADLEAELGVDSIKRVEIISAIKKRVPAAVWQRVQDSVEALTRARSLEPVVEILSGAASHEPVRAAAVAGAAESGGTRDPVGASAQGGGPARLVMEPLVRQVTDFEKGLADLVMVTGGAGDGAGRVAAFFESCGARVVRVDAGDLISRDRVRERIQEERARHGDVRVIVHMAGCGRADGGVEQLEWLLHGIQASAEDLRRGGGRLLVVSRMDGMFGRSGAWGGGGEWPAAGGGLVRCVAKEWPGLRVRAVDISADLGEERLGAILWSEARDREDVAEAGWRGDRRMIFHPAERGHAEPRGSAGGVRMEDLGVVMVSGGGRGIAAEIAIRLSRPGVILELAGRSEPGAGEGGAEVARTLDRIRGAGGEAVYTPVDLGDSLRARKWVEAVYERRGRVDAVFHASGVLEDSSIESKSAESLKRVNRSKACAWAAIEAGLRPEGLKAVVLFTSIAGRFGNLGQGDYAAANEYLNRRAWSCMARWPETRVVSINWGPWADVGMASGAVVQARFRAMGLAPIAIEEGWRFLQRELEWGGRQDVEIVAAPEGVARLLRKGGL